ncbi:MAG: Protein-L-isoaspartate O-methyltransferase [Alphaproteobacteria bacterium MarineAlpha6_Bin4]|nr:MAG: Protein-L-isoaspartate O-methyltransferase [Alphaproteobacteria bacterium MarineAlpha6_Bin3]PPR37045.1 MAG: Protein-L-isoaspartate O-methyltransferase [Alphaproteobacteria bacterium MarineAlpha6_Bin4]|tara:strand:- start:4841 stop:5497 length:657 start_codon:yes stop_codon:yes gene_type:complete
MSDFNIARKNMVNNQLLTNNIVEDYILNAFNLIPREIFLPSERRTKAYLDEDIEIDTDRYLMEPRIIGNIIKLSKIDKNHIVLDLACSTGYSSAVLSKLSKKVYGVDSKKDLVKQAERNIKKLKINNVTFSTQKVIENLNQKFDFIFIFGGVEFIPINLFKLLKNNGGTLITVLYNNSGLGKIHIIKKIKGKISRSNYISAQTPILNDFKKVKKEFIL